MRRAALERHIFILLVAVIYYIIGRRVLLVESLDYDEIICWNWVTGSWTYLWENLLKDTQSFVYYGFIKIFHIFIPLKNDYWFRAPGLLFGSLSMALWSYHWHKQHFFKPIFIVLFVFLLGFNPLFQYISTYGRGYILLFFLISYLVIRISDQINSARVLDSNNLGRVIKFSYLDILAISLLINTHHLGVIWLSGVMISILILKVKINWGQGKSSVIKKVILAVSFLFFVWFFIKQWPNRGLTAWSMEFYQHPEHLLSQIFGYGSYFWLLFIISKLVLVGERASFNFKFWLFQIIIVLSIFAIAGAFSINLFIFRYLCILIPVVLILQEETLIWVLSPKFQSHILYLWILLVSVFLTYGDADLRLLQRFGPKNLFVGLRQQGVITDKTNVACIILRARPENFLNNYSKVYFNKDICTEYLDSMASENIKSFDYLLVLNIGSIYEPADFVTPDGWILKDQSVADSWFFYKNKCDAIGCRD